MHQIFKDSTIKPIHEKQKDCPSPGHRTQPCSSGSQSQQQGDDPERANGHSLDQQIDEPCMRSLSGARKPKLKIDTFGGFHNHPRVDNSLRWVRHPNAAFTKALQFACKNGRSADTRQAAE